MIENLSVMLQVSYFIHQKNTGRASGFSAWRHSTTTTKRKTCRTQIVARFWIVGLMLAVLTIVTLKVR